MATRSRAGRTPSFSNTGTDISDSILTGDQSTTLLGSDHQTHADIEVRNVMSDLECFRSMLIFPEDETIVLLRDFEQGTEEGGRSSSTGDRYIGATGVWRTLIKFPWIPLVGALSGRLCFSMKNNLLIFSQRD